MKEGQFIFVYGSLRRGGSADLSKKPNNTFVTEDRVNGELYHIGWFPGVNELVPVEKASFNPGKPAVVGEVFTIDHPSLVRLLDVYEGHPDFFNRILVSTEKGLTVWVYQFPWDVSDKPRIYSGDWMAYLDMKEPLSEIPNRQIG